jgi:hypothetical protein
MPETFSYQCDHCFRANDRFHPVSRSEALPFYVSRFDDGDAPQRLRSLSSAGNPIPVRFSTGAITPAFLGQ